MSDRARHQVRLVTVTELERSQRVIEQALRCPLPLDVKRALQLQQRRNRIAIEAQTSPCGHPLALARLDGMWPLDAEPYPTASVTCGAAGCGSSFNLPVRKDFAERWLALNAADGGARGRVIGCDDTTALDARVIPRTARAGTLSATFGA